MGEKKVKILFFISKLSEGGAEKVLCNLVNNMDQDRFDITVQTNEKVNSKQFLTEGIHYKYINHTKTAIGNRLFSYFYRLMAELKLAYSIWVKDDYDIEVAYLETEPTKIIAQSTNKKAKKIAWVHCDLSKKEGMDHSVRKVKKQYKKFDRIVCVSRDVESGFRELYGTEFPTTVLYNVIDEDEILGKSSFPLDEHFDPSVINLIAVGRLTEQKNYAYLIDACSKLYSDGCRFHLRILGEGPEREHLESQIQMLGLNNVVELKGFTTNPYPYMKQSDVVVCSSKYEGISTVVQEAFILGKPVVTTPCTGMKELLGCSEYGIIADACENGLYFAIKSMIESLDIRQNYAHASFERGIKFRKAVSIMRTEELFIHF